MLLFGLLAAGVAGLGYYLFMSPGSQAFGDFPYRVRTSEKVFALTFDDGPNPPYTAQILEKLDRHAVPATFFVVGRNLERSPEAAAAILAAGHTIGNHAYSHAFRRYFAQPAFRNEIEQGQAAIERLTGRRPALFRPPWLFRHPTLLASAKRAGLTTVSGVFLSEIEVFQPQARRIARRAVQKVRPGTIGIFHDGCGSQGGNRSETVAALDLIIPELKARGYRFVTVDQLLCVSPYQPRGSETRSPPGPAAG